MEHSLLSFSHETAGEDEDCCKNYNALSLYENAAVC